ncbi:MAG TPA: DUF3618 domain-containing protein [Pyrinomonadaceae bacterium]
MDQRTDLGIEPGESNTDTVAEIQEEVVEARIKVGETVDEIQERLTVNAISSQIKEAVSEKVSDAVDSTKDAVYNATVKPVKNTMARLGDQLGIESAADAGKTVLPYLLIGTGVGLLVMNRWSSSGNNRDRNRHAMPDRTSDSKTGLSSTVGNAYSEVKSTASGVYHTIGDTASSAASRVGDAASYGMEVSRDYFESNPVAVGAVAAALGAAVGFAIPLSATETEYLEGTGRAIKGKVEEVAQDTVERAKDTAEELVDRLADARDGKSDQASGG